MNKAPVLSDEGIKEAWYGIISTADKLPKIPDLVSVVAEAQRDADDAYYRPILDGFEVVIKSYQQYCKSYRGIIEDLSKRIQQAKQETAREILEEIEAYCQSGQCWLKTESPFNWQSLKTKYLNEYCVDCNGEVAVKLEDCPRRRRNDREDSKTIKKYRQQR